MAKFAGVTARSDPAVGDPAVVYRLRIMVAGISPLIWRRLLVPGETTLAELHAVVQTVFGWAVSTFIASSSTAPSTASPTSVARASATTTVTCGLVSWGYARVSGSPTTTTSPLAGGSSCAWSRSRPAGRDGSTRAVSAGAGPAHPRSGTGPGAFVEQTQPHLVFAAIVRAAEIVGRLLDADEDDIVDVVLGEDRDELATLMPLLGLERFDRRACNTALTTATATATKESSAWSSACR